MTVVISRLFYFGMTRKDTPLAVREHFRLEPSERDRLLQCLASLTNERLVLSTCERFEVYALSEDPCLPVWCHTIAASLPRRADMLRHFGHMLTGRQAAERLLRVTAGLESSILGEHQILGQVREAYQASLECRAVGPILSAVGRAALRTGKRIRNETPLNRAGVSLARLTRLHLIETIGKLDKARLLVLGSGEMAREVVRELTLQGQARVLIAGRNVEAVQSLAHRYGAQAARLKDIAGLIACADGLIACTSARTPLVHRETLAQADGRRLMVVDLGVPRNVAVSAGELQHVSLVHMDDLVAHGKPEQALVMAQAERIVSEELERVDAWCRERVAAPVIAALVQAAQAGTAMDRTAATALHHRILELKREAAA